MSRYRHTWWLLALALLVHPLQAQESRPLYGISGAPALITVPTALMPQPGTIGFGFSSASPYNTLYLVAQPADWLHVGMRYVAITSRHYNDISTNSQSYKDKSFDLAVRAWDESRWRPAVAVSISDLGGTGLFAGESIVATKHFGRWVATLGLGFGRLGTRGDLSNPVASLIPRARNRELLAYADRQGGIPAIGDWFGGRRASIIGGIEWAPAYKPWSIQLELDGNDYSIEPVPDESLPGPGPVKGRLDVASRLNIGMRYQLPGSWFAGVAYVRGNTLVGHVGIAPRLGRDHAPPTPLPAARHLQYPPSLAEMPLLDSEQGVNDWTADLVRSKIYPHAAAIDPDQGTLTLWQTNRLSESSLDALRVVGRKTLARLPDEIQQIEVVDVVGGLDALQLSADRATLDAEARGQLSTDQLRQRVTMSARPEITRAQAQYPQLLVYPSWRYGIEPAFRTNIGGADGFLIGQVVAKPFASLQLTPRLGMIAAAGVNLLNNLDRLNDPTPSGNLPAVRSDLNRFQTSSSAAYLDRWMANYMLPLAEDWFARISGGYLEEMYGGIASEILYRPVASAWALGLDLNYVKKRSYAQWLGFQDYQVATGHLTGYYRAPRQGVVVKLSAGRYLARDWGATLDVAREFRNGVVIGAFATQTNVSSADFGEGSFDKGVYLRIPLGVLVPGRSRGDVNFSYRFLSRDGGQKVRNGRQLYSVFGRYTAEQLDAP